MLQPALICTQPSMIVGRKTLPAANLKELIAWIKADYGLSELDAYELLSKVARIRLSEMVDTNYVVIAKVAKKYLPKAK